MTSANRRGLIYVLLCALISIWWGTSIARDKNAWIDFRAVYAGTRCLLSGHNPYNESQLTREYQNEEGLRPQDSLSFQQAVTLYVNLPTAFVIVAPFAVLPWGVAHIFWSLITGAALIVAILLMWNVGAKYSPLIATFLACILAANCETIFGTGNTAGLVVALCVIAVWCFLEERFVWLGIVCMALSLAIKPHDSGFVWLYFLLVGGAARKRALRSFAITALIGIAAFAWVTAVAPHWMLDWNANMAKISAPGGINDPGPNALTGRSPAMVVDLQAAISIFRDDPGVYNPISYAVCGVLLLIWAVQTLRMPFTQRNAWIGLTTATALTMLVTYHRPWDAKLIMLAIPACCTLAASNAAVRKSALIVTTIGIIFTGDIALALLTLSAKVLHAGAGSSVGKVVSVVLMRPSSIALLLTGVYYLWTYLRKPDRMAAASV